MSRNRDTAPLPATEADPGSAPAGHARAAPTAALPERPSPAPGAAPPAAPGAAGERLRAALAAALPPGRLTTGADRVAPYAYDRSGARPAGAPLAVVHPESTEETATALRHAHGAGVPVVPRGAGTGLSGGALADAGSLVLDLSRMNRIRQLAPEDQLAVVEAGVRTADLDRAAAAHGLRYAPDPASAALSTLGGNIATNAGGLRCAKYGVTREALLGLEAVLADGTVLATGRRTVKGVTGYDLTALLTGSEGTLAVITAATVRLRPLPAETGTLAAFFDSFAQAAAASTALTGAGVEPALAELLDGSVLAALDAHQGTELRARGRALLLVQCDGTGAAADTARAAGLLTAHGATHVETAEDPARADALLAARRLALPALERLGRVLIEDIAVPRSQLATAVHEIQRVSATHRVPVHTLAHAADGNLHPILITDPELPDIPDRVWRAADEIFATAIRLGGTLTGEHGVGLLKRRWLRRELGADALALHHRVKDAFDPRHLLNPGKAL